VVVLRSFEHQTNPMVLEAMHRFKLAMSLFARLAISLYTIFHNHMMLRACNQLGPKT
jgi:hypothetical protein